MTWSWLKKPSICPWVVSRVGLDQETARTSPWYKSCSCQPTVVLKGGGSVREAPAALALRPPFWRTRALERLRGGRGGAATRSELLLSPGRSRQPSCSLPHASPNRRQEHIANNKHLAPGQLSLHAWVEERRVRATRDFERRALQKGSLELTRRQT